MGKTIMPLSVVQLVHLFTCASFDLRNFDRSRYLSHFRDKDSLRFIKYVNSRLEKPFHDLQLTYYEWYLLSYSEMKYILELSILAMHPVLCQQVFFFSCCLYFGSTHSYVLYECWTLIHSSLCNQETICLFLTLLKLK